MTRTEQDNIDNDLMGLLKPILNGDESGAAQDFVNFRGQLNAFVENVPIAIALIAPDGTYISRSNDWIELHQRIFKPGFRDNFLRGIEVRKDWQALFHHGMAGHSASGDEDALTLLDGSVEFMNWAMEPWRSPDGSVCGIVLSMTLITDQVKARKAAERQTRLLNAVLESVDEGIVACDQDGQLTLFNQKTRVMHGIDAVSIPIEDCGDYYSLYEADSLTPLSADRIPLFRALRGERVEAQAMVIAPDGLPRRDILATGSQLLDANGKVIGAVASMSDVTAANIATRKLKQSEAQARYTALHDPLTGLANRAQFNSLYGNGDTLEPGCRKAVLFIDLDRFKFVNDTLGHKVGDDLLIRVSGILTTTLGHDAFVARFGGDEFVCVFDVDGTAGALNAASEIHSRLNRPIAISGHTVVTGAAIGIAMSPDHGDRVDDLVRRADLAMYRGKSRKSGVPVPFEAIFERDAIRRTHLEAELIKAIRTDQLHLLYQPVVNAKSGQIEGVEALIRWTHPELGHVSPEIFIPIAEDCGFITELGQWILEEAIRELAPYPELFLAVNLSPLQIGDGAIVGRIAALLERISFDPRRLELEVTEGLLIEDADVAKSVITRLKAKGIGVALDDFGTGYSSLSYIQKIPFSKVKIDRSFVQTLATSPTSQAVVRCVVDLASALGMTVTAEGVETEQHEDMLRRLGCHTLQGYHYSPPLPLKDILQKFKPGVAQMNVVPLGLTG